MGRGGRVLNGRGSAREAGLKGSAHCRVLAIDLLEEAQVRGQCVCVCLCAWWEDLVYPLSKFQAYNTVFLLSSKFTPPAWPKMCTLWPTSPSPTFGQPLSSSAFVNFTISDSTYTWVQAVFLFLCLAYFTQCDVLLLYPCGHIGWNFLLPVRQSHCACIGHMHPFLIFSLSIHSSRDM